MDERFAAMPMIKLDHLLQSTPVFCHVVPGSDSSGSLEGGSKTTKVLLGSHSSQEIMMLQYSGQSTLEEHQLANAAVVAPYTCKPAVTDV